MNPPDTSARPMGLAHPGVLDAFAHDKRRDLLQRARTLERRAEAKRTGLRDQREKPAGG